MELTLASLVNESLFRWWQWFAAPAQVAAWDATRRKQLPLSAEGNERFADRAPEPPGSAERRPAARPGLRRHCTRGVRDRFLTTPVAWSAPNAGSPWLRRR